MSQAQQKKQRRSTHPGVRILALKTRAGRPVHQARFNDSESGKLVCLSFEAMGINSAEGRRAWATRKSAELKLRKDDLRIRPETFDDARIEQAVERYLETSKTTLRPKTHRAYADALAQFSGWARRVGVLKTSQINMQVLARYREYVIALPNGRSKKGGRRGARTATTHPRAPRTVNRDQEYLRTWLRWLIRGSMLPALTNDGIANALRRVPTHRPQPEFLSFADVRKLLEAAMAHDAQCFRMTRAEHDGGLVPGRMPRHEAIAPVALTLLLSGMRRGELLGLQWSDIDLDARDDHGHAVGEIRIRPEATKTKIGRTVDLSVAPALRELLRALRERSTGEGRVFEHSDHMLRPPAASPI